MSSRISGSAGPWRQERESSEDSESVRSELGLGRASTTTPIIQMEKPRPEIS